MQLTRRAALEGAFLTAVLGGTSSFAANFDTKPRLLVVHLRGGLDALAAVPPYGDPHFTKVRGTLSPGEVPDGLKLDRLFALHPAFSRLLPYYYAGELLIAVGTAIPNVGRSHVVAEQALFDVANGEARLGWVGRAASEVSGRKDRLFADSTADRSYDLLLDLALANPSLDFANVFARSLGCKAGCLATMLEDRSKHTAAHFSQAINDAARAFLERDGAQIAFVELPGFDTHVAQGRDTGRLAQSLRTLASGLVEFAEASSAVWRSTAVLVVSEFGRTVTANSNLGTDHGTAGVALLLGGAVAGGTTAKLWPGIAPERLLLGTDLSSVVDLRSIVKSVLIEHLRLPGDAVARVMPNALDTATMHRLFRASSAS